MTLLDSRTSEMINDTVRVVIDPDVDTDIRCAMCRSRKSVFMVEKHHIWPKGWGGPTTEAEVARWSVWVYADGNCHNTTHLILDHMKRVGEWDKGYLEHWGFPRGPVHYAKVGWGRYVESLEGRERANGP